MRDASSYSASEIWTEDQSNIADKLLRYYGTHTDVTVDDLTEHFLEQNPGHSRPLIEETWTQNASLSSLFRNCRDTKLSSHTSLGQNTTRYILGAYKFHRSHSRRLDCSRRRAQEFYNSRYYPSQHRRTLGSQLSSPTDAYQGLLPTTRSSAKQKMSLTMKTQHRRRPQPLPTRTFIPYISESKYWSLFVLTRNNDEAAFQLR